MLFWYKFFALYDNFFNNLYNLFFMYLYIIFPLKCMYMQLYRYWYQVLFIEFRALIFYTPPPLRSQCSSNYLVKVSLIIMFTHHLSSVQKTTKRIIFQFFIYFFLSQITHASHRYAIKLHLQHHRHVQMFVALMYRVIQKSESS